MIIILHPQATCYSDPLCSSEGYCTDTTNDLGTHAELRDCLSACVYDAAGYNYCDYEASTGACYGGSTCGDIIPALSWATYAVNDSPCSPEPTAVRQCMDKGRCRRLTMPYSNLPHA